MYQDPDITILGTIVFDIFVPDVVSYPTKGQAIGIEKFSYFTGGCGSNTSIVLSKLGVKVSLIGAVGNDLFGEHILSYLKKNKVDTSLVKISSQNQTSTSILFINRKNERSYFHSIGASKEIKIGSEERKAIFKSKIFHIGGVNLLPTIDGKPMAEILKKARLKKVITSIDLAWDTENKWMNKLKFSIPFIDILMGNEGEIKALTGKKNLNSGIEFLHRKGIKIVIVKLGQKGSIVSKNFLMQHVPSFNVNAKDSTGAGDAFAGGFLFGVLSGLSLFDAARVGNYFGALVTKQYGSTSALSELNSIKLSEINLNSDRVL